MDADACGTTAIGPLSDGIERCRRAGAPRSHRPSIRRDDHRPVRGAAGAIAAPAAGLRVVFARVHRRSAVQAAAGATGDQALRRAQVQRSGLVYARRGYREVLLLACEGSHSGQLKPATSTRHQAQEAAMNISLAKQASTTKTHLLQSRPETVHWGFFDGALDPVLTIDSGDRVAIECVSGNPEWMPPKSTGFDVLPELQQIHQQVKRGTGNHILTGPIFVRGAAVGDVLEVRIAEIDLRQNWGYNLFRAYGGTLPDEFPYYRIIHVALDRERNRAILPSRLTVPMRPFFGQLGVAPATALGRQHSEGPREFAGNIESKEHTA